ncbi:hypothetical protein EXY23_12040 [Roseicella aquatilis]|uniref:Uncharacterized protein n=1 Tax=Roseicella aquatilis TaxID=2527868 RepID=A0A4R4DIW3_9PROT|nr:hypothetical protein EXY23_12040 [Roseicella aquatilis]
MAARRPPANVPAPPGGRDRRHPRGRRRPAAPAASRRRRRPGRAARCAPAGGRLPACAASPSEYEALVQAAAAGRPPAHNTRICEICTRKI